MAAAATWAITLDGARDGAIVAAVAGVVAAVMAVWLLKQVVSKLVTVAVVGVLVALVWSQRTSLDVCADRVAATLTDGVTDDGSCTFFGQDVVVTRAG
jgi:predicted membrane-bound spermidine synthase